MGAFVAQQPNGLYCRFSSVVDTVTHWNMTFDEYVEQVQMKRSGRSHEAAVAEAHDTINNYLQPFQEIINRFRPINDTVEEFNEILREMGSDVQLNKEDYESDMENPMINSAEEEIAECKAKLIEQLGLAKSDMPKDIDSSSKNTTD